MALDRPLQEILDKLAGVALLAEPDDEAALAALKESVAACREAPDAAALSMPLASLAAQVAAAQGGGEAGGRADALAAVRRAFAALQEQLAGGGAPAPAAGNAFALPEWVEEAIFEEFIAGHELVLEELEAEILAVEKGGQRGAGEPAPAPAQPKGRGRGARAVGR